EGVEELPTPFDIAQLKVMPDKLRDVCVFLKEHGFNVLMDVAGVDYLPRTPRFEVVYHLVALPSLWRLRLRVPVDESHPAVPTVSDSWPTATRVERVVWGLLAIRVAGFVHLSRLLPPYD